MCRLNVLWITGVRQRAAMEKHQLNFLIPQRSKSYVLKRTSPDCSFGRVAMVSLSLEQGHDLLSYLCWINHGVPSIEGEKTQKEKLLALYLLCNTLN